MHKGLQACLATAVACHSLSCKSDETNTGESRTQPSTGEKTRPPPTLRFLWQPSTSSPSAWSINFFTKKPSKDDWQGEIFNEQASAPTQGTWPDLSRFRGAYQRNPEGNHCPRSTILVTRSPRISKKCLMMAPTLSVEDQRKDQQVQKSPLAEALANFCSPLQTGDTFRSKFKNLHRSTQRRPTRMRGVSCKLPGKAKEGEDHLTRHARWRVAPGIGPSHQALPS